MQVFSQKGDDDSSIPFSPQLLQTKGFQYTLTTNEPWALSRRTKTYENQGMWHSEYLALNPDSTFVLVSYFEVGNTFSAGKWRKRNDSTYVLNWDAERATALTRSEVHQKKYGIRPIFPLRIENWVLIKRGGSLICPGFEGDVVTTVRSIDSLVAMLENEKLLVQVQTNELWDSAGKNKFSTVDTAYFDRNFKLVKFISTHTFMTSKGTNETRQISYFLLPDRQYKITKQYCNSAEKDITFYIKDQVQVNDTPTRVRSDDYHYLTSLRRRVSYENSKQRW